MCNQLAMIRNKIKKHDKVYIKRRQIRYCFQRCDKKTHCIYSLHCKIDFCFCFLKVKITLSDKLLLILYISVFFLIRIYIQNSFKF